MSQFFRHPSAVPVRYSLLNGETKESVEQPLKKISGSGLSFFASEPLEINTDIRVAIRVKIPPFEAEARVVWCNPVKGYYEIGVRFIDRDADFNLRMVQQVCHIEQFKRDIYTQEGRQLNNEEAAAEWISRHAEDFPR